MCMYIEFISETRLLPPIPTTIVELHQLNQWCEFGAGLIAVPFSYSSDFSPAL